MCFATGCRGGKGWGGMQNINHIFLFVSFSFVCMFCIFQALDTLFAAWHVSVIRILCSSYYILHISRRYISVGTFLLGTFKNFTEKTTLSIYTHVSHGHYLSTHVRLDHNMMTVHLRTVARAFLQVSIGPAQQLHPRSCNPIKSCTTAGITICIWAYRKCFRLPFVSMAVVMFQADVERH